MSRQIQTLHSYNLIVAIKVSSALAFERMELQKNTQFELSKRCSTVDYYKATKAQQAFIDKLKSSVLREGKSFFKKYNLGTDLLFHPNIPTKANLNFEEYDVKPVVVWCPHLFAGENVVCHRCGSNAYKLTSDQFVQRTVCGYDDTYFILRHDAMCSNCNKKLNTISEDFLEKQAGTIKAIFPGIMESKKLCYDQRLRTYFALHSFFH